MRSITISSRAFLFLVVALAGSLGSLAGIVATLALQPSPIRELPLYASATDTGTSMSMATGLVDDMEGVSSSTSSPATWRASCSTATSPT
jgi:hypothetical protein